MALDPELSSRLERIERLLRGSWWSLVWQSALRGAGFVAGTALAVVLLGWVLGAFGIIPGLGDLAQRLQASLTR